MYDFVNGNDIDLLSDRLYEDEISIKSDYRTPKEILTFIDRINGHLPTVYGKKIWKSLEDYLDWRDGV